MQSQYQLRVGDRAAGTCGALVVGAALLGGCRIDPASADAYGASTGSGSSGVSTLGSSGGSGDDVGSGSGGSSSDDGSTLTLGVDATGTTGTTGADETAGTTGDESSSGDVEVCGDGRLDDRNEVCDDGMNDGSYGGCMPGCQPLSPHCGDGVPNEPEEVCDDGLNDGGYGGCMPGCLMHAEHCGDSVPNGPEVCDDGVNDGSYDGCAPGCGMPGPSCGDVRVNGPELCDDGMNDGSYGGCMPDCVVLAEHCGDWVVNGPELCDDGVNDGGYGSCGFGCLSPPLEYCGDGIVNGPEACDDGNFESYDGCLANCAVPTSCVDIKSFDTAAPDGVYVIDPDGSGGQASFEAHCNMMIDGGGWQLVSVRHEDVGVLFADGVCTGIDANCSGTIPDVQLVLGDAPDLLFATTDGVYWLRVTGLNPIGSALLDVITLNRVLTETTACDGGQYCGENLDVGLMVAGSSQNYVPRFIALPSQWARLGGIWLGNGGGSEFHHVVSLNYISYTQCVPEAGLQLSDASTEALGNVTCSEPGALYFRY